VAGPDHVSGTPWERSVVPADAAISLIRSVTLAVKQLEPTEAVLMSLFGFRKTDERDGRHRYEVEEGGPGRTVDILVDASGPAGRPGHGSVHHVAFRIGSDAEQLDARVDLVGRGFQVSPVMDRDYFKSIYFREPGGILFEVATDGPGFTVDEPADALGTALQLPKQFRAHRGQIERALTPLKLL
jgi:glyoxalase family protein